jgi:molecular chaperone DnaJ
MEDLYQCLGIPRSANAEEIKKAYRQKAREHHPDTHTGKEEQDKHAEIFKKIVNAYEVLSDPHKKAQYDIQGRYGRRPSTPPPQKQKKPPVKTKEDFEKEFAEDKKKEELRSKKSKFEPMDINCIFYGGESSGRSIMVHVKLTPQELKNGCSKSVTIKKRDFCTTCGGDGFGLFPCKKCANNPIAKQVCGACNCVGVLDGPCPHCNGTGMGLWMIEDVYFKVSPNTQPGHSIMVLGQGEMAQRKPPGNVRIVVL